MHNIFRWAATKFSDYSQIVPDLLSLIFHIKGWTKVKNGKASRSKGVDNDATTRLQNLSLASRDLDLWPTDPQRWSFHKGKGKCIYIAPVL